MNAADRLRERIVAKAGGCYNIADVPFLVAVGVHDTFCSDDQVMDALYGGESVVVATGQVVRRNDGVFGRGRERSEGRHRRVSATAVVNGLRWWEPELADVALYDNPYATRVAPDELLRWTRRYGSVKETAAGVRFGWRTGHPPAPES